MTGRKPKFDKPKSEQLSIRMTPEQKALIERVARNNGALFGGTATFWHYWMVQMAEALDKNQPFEVNLDAPPDHLVTHEVK